MTTEVDVGSYEPVLNNEDETQINKWYHIKVASLALLCILINAVLCYINFGLDGAYKNDARILSYTVPAILFYSSSVGILTLIPFKYIYNQYNACKIGFYVLVLLYMSNLVFLFVFNRITSYKYHSISYPAGNLYTFVVFPIIFGIVLKCLSWKRRIIDSRYSVLCCMITYVGFFIHMAMKLLFPKFQGTIFFVVILLAIYQVICYKKNETIRGSFLFCVTFSVLIPVIEYIGSFMDVVDSFRSWVPQYWIFFVGSKVFSFIFENTMHCMSQKSGWEILIQYKFFATFCCNLYQTLFFVYSNSKNPLLHYLSLLLSEIIATLLTDEPVLKYLIDILLSIIQCQFTSIFQLKMDVSLNIQLNHESNVLSYLLSKTSILAHLCFMYYHQNLYQWINIHHVALRLFSLIIVRLILYMIIQYCVFKRQWNKQKIKNRSWKQSTVLLSNNERYVYIIACITYGIYFSFRQVINYGFVFDGNWEYQNMY